MLQPLVWLVGLEAVGVVALPLAFVLFRRLPDRGLSLAKPLGLLLTFYIFWLLGSTGFIPNSPGTIIGVLASLALVALAVWWPRRRQFARFLHSEGRTLLLSELIFLAFFLGWVWIRAQLPFIQHTEQPMDFAFLNTTVRSPEFPPQDPWLAGFSISYYYFGYLMMGGVTTLTELPTSVSYNLALATIPALAASAIFGLVYNLVRLSKGSIAGATGAGLVAVALLVVVGNLEGVLEFFQAADIGSDGFWGWLGVGDLSSPTAAATGFYPDRFWWWFQAGRVLPGGEITEFPVFSFVLGDLHPHVMSLPFLFLAMGLLLNVFAAGEPIGGGWVRRNKGAAVALALFLGALAFINMGDLPTLALLAGVLFMVRAYGQTGGRLLRAATRGLAAALPVFALAVLLFVPFYLTFHTQATGVLPFREEPTRPVHFLLLWGLFLILGVTFLVFQLREIPHDRMWRRRALLATGLAAAPLALWVLAEAAVLPAVRGWREVVNASPLEGALAVALEGSLSDVPANIGRRVVGVLPLIALLAAAVYAVLGRAREERDTPSTFVLVLLALAAFLIMVPELFFVADVFGNRMNTVFKLYYQAWAFLAVASGYGLYYVQRRWALQGTARRVGAVAWWSVLGIVVAGALYYPGAALHARITQEGGPQFTLDGLAHVAQRQPEEFAAIQFLQAHAPRDAVILEAVGPDYTEFGRISASTGIPTVIGWIGHERQWRGSSNPYEGRAQDVEEMYRTQDVERARALLEKYDIDYVVVGPRERQQYGTEGLSKFGQLAQPCFPGQDEPGPCLSLGNVTLYRVAQ